MTIDGTSRADDRASCWVRVAQTWAGAGRGALFIPPRQPRVYGRHDVPDIERLTRLQARTVLLVLGACLVVSAGHGMRDLGVVTRRGEGLHRQDLAVQFWAGDQRLWLVLTLATNSDAQRASNHFGPMMDLAQNHRARRYDSSMHAGAARTHADRAPMPLWAAFTRHSPATDHARLRVLRSAQTIAYPPGTSNRWLARMRNVHSIPGTDVLASLPVLPLPNVVLLPGMVLPLNVHQPKYLELVDFVRAHGNYVGVPLLLPSAPEGEAPALAPVFGLGKLVFHVQLDDGRRIIRLEGVGRVRTQRELPRSRGFRELTVTALAEPYPTDPKLITVLKAQVERITQYCGEDGEGLQSLLTIEDPRSFLYSLTAFLPSLELLVCDEADVTDDEQALVSLQQRSLAAETADDRAYFLLERTSRIVDLLGAQSMSAARLLN